MFIDTHTHLYSDSFSEDRTETINRAINAGIERLLLPNIDIHSINGMHALTDEFPNNCFAMMGLHPGNVKEDWKDQLKVMKNHLDTRKYIAIGEIGMDLYWDKTFIEEQKEAFRIQVGWAKEYDLPIVIHARDAFDEIFEILDELNDEKLTGVFHCFTGDASQAEKVISYNGFKMGIGGVLTYKKAGLDETLKGVPLEYLILETDAPYLPPTPHRGKRNESSYLLHIAEKLTDVYGVSMTEIENVTTKNAVQLFGSKIS
jgi:TatD DNase family protein